MLIIYAHPTKTGHCGYILEQVKKYLNAQKKSYEFLDLYTENYDPVLKKNEHYSSSNNYLTDDTIKYQTLLKKHQEIIVIYPTWWNSTPAILKGWFDRVLTRKFAFEYIGHLPHGLLHGKVVVITTTGGPAFYEKIFAKNRSLKTVTHDVFKFCGYRTKGYLFGSATELDDKNKKRIKKIVNKAMKNFN